MSKFNDTDFIDFLEQHARVIIYHPDNVVGEYPLEHNRNANKVNPQGGLRADILTGMLWHLQLEIRRNQEFVEQCTALTNEFLQNPDDLAVRNRMIEAHCRYLRHINNSVSMVGTSLVEKQIADAQATRAQQLANSLQPMLQSFGLEVHANGQNLVLTSVFNKNVKDQNE